MEAKISLLGELNLPNEKRLYVRGEVMLRESPCNTQSV